MNLLVSLLISTFIATSLMTLFSYIVSAGFRELYKEPLLLKYILIKFKINVSDQVKEVFAWGIHYTIGLLFVLSYYFLYHYKLIHFIFLTGFYLGAISGIIGIIGWIIMFKLSGFNHKINDKGYYIQLFVAHVIFGLTAVLTFWFLHNVLYTN